jgi:hypothetical protein
MSGSEGRGPGSTETEQKHPSRIKTQNQGLPFPCLFLPPGHFLLVGFVELVVEGVKYAMATPQRGRYPSFGSDEVGRQGLSLSSSSLPSRCVGNREGPWHQCVDKMVNLAYRKLSGSIIPDFCGRSRKYPVPFGALLMSDLRTKTTSIMHNIFPTLSSWCVRISMDIQLR